MNFKLKKLFLKKILKRDTMKIDIEQYRKSGSKIGENVRTFSPIVSAEPYLIEILDNVTISSGVSFTTHDNSVSKIIDGATDVFGKIKIGNNCFIGQNAIILPGVSLGDNTIVGAGAVVTKSFPDGNVVIGGNPAKIICSIYQYENKMKDKVLNTLNLNYDEKKDYLLENENKFIVK